MLSLDRIIKFKFILLFVRKLVSYSLFFLVTWQIIGFVAYFEFTHYHLKKEIKLLLKQGVPQDELVVFEFDKTELSNLIWLKKNEFNYNGNLFDVVRSHKMADGKTYMECISDKQETVLFAKLNQGISSNMGDERNPTPLFNWLKIIHFPVVTNCFELNFKKSSIDSINRSYFIYQEDNSVKIIEIDSPPPEFS